MTNKRVIYVLLPAAALVWGLIVYRIWQAVETDAAPVAVADASVSTAVPRATNQLPKLSLAYRDPFRRGPVQQAGGKETTSSLKEVTHSAPRKLSALPVMNVNASKPVPTVVTWPSVEFLGAIENRQNHRRIALLTIDGQQTSLAETQAAQGLKVLRVFKDSVQTEFQHQRRTLKAM